MVIQGSAALLGKVNDLPAPAARAVSRIRAAADEMALLTETFLLLGRKEAVERPPQQVAPLIRRELTRLAPCCSGETLNIRLQLDEESEVKAPPPARHRPRQPLEKRPELRRGAHRDHPA